MAEGLTIGRMLINNALPEELQDSSRVLNKKSTQALFQELASKYPDKYVEILHKLNSVSRIAGTEYGGIASIRLKDLKLPPRIKEYRKEIRNKVDNIAQDPSLTKEQKNDKIVNYMRRVMPTIQKNLQAELKGRDNSFALGLEQGFRGNPTQIAQLLFGDMLVADHKGRAIPIPGLHGYGEGVTPSEYWAGSYGSRKGYCLDENTLVRMADMSVKAIKDIQVGEEVLGADISGSTFPTKVVNVYNNGIKDVNRYTFRVGRMDSFVTLEATEDHQVLAVFKEGSRRPELRTPSKLPLSQARRTFSMVPAGPTEDNREESQPWALLLGALLGDGHLSRQNSVTLSSVDISFIDHLRSELAPEALTLRYKERKRASGMPSCEYAIVQETQTYIGAGFRNPMKQWLDQFNLLGKRSWEKDIPREVFSWSSADVAKVIYGLFETDGYCRRSSANSAFPCVGWELTSKPLLESLKELLETRFGIYTTTISTIPQSTTKSISYGYVISASRASYSLRVSSRTSVERFVRYIAHDWGNKGRKLLSMMEDAPESPRDDRLMFSFKTKEYLGERQTYDIEVAHEDHLFVLANGMVVSNSDVQFATAKTGFLGKQLALMAQRLKVTGEDCGADSLGIPMSGDDTESIGSVLSKEVNGIPAGTVISKKHLPALEGNQLLVRSISTCQQDKGICQKCAGQRDQGKFPPVGSYVGISSARTISEPLTQLGLSSKHSGGVVGLNDQTVTGFDEINQFLQIPKNFKGGAVLAPLDGRVKTIAKAPQGGQYMHVGDEQIYIPEGREIQVVKGQDVEAGDVLTTGTPNPSEIARYKGLGEGRSYFINKFYDILKDNGVPTHRRHVDVLARAFFDKVKITNPDGLSGHTMGDVISYSELQKGYKPRAGFQERAPGRSVGWYLERPVLHYTIGTKITDKVAKNLAANKITKLPVHKEDPGFEPEVVRLMAVTGSDPDWKTQLAGFNIKKNFYKAVRRGSESPTDNTSYVPKLLDPTRL
jgi:hypothetical protein